MLRRLRAKLDIHPRAWWDSLMTHPRFVGRIKPALLGAAEAEVTARLSILRHCTEVSRLECPAGRRILAISPHPDDETVGAGGFLLAHRGRAALHFITIFNGERGGRLDGTTWNGSPEYRARLVQARKDEIGEVAKRMGVESVTALDLPDDTATFSENDAARLRQAIEKINPDVVLLPWYVDGQSDHRLANKLYASVAAERGGMVLAYGIWSPCPANATFSLERPGLFEEKLELVRLFRTQLATVDYENLARSQAHLNGFLHGIGSLRNQPAEAFFALPNRTYCSLVNGFAGTAHGEAA